MFLYYFMGVTMKDCSLSKKLIAIVALFFVLSANAIADSEREKPILLIGASYETGLTPLDDNIEGPFFGWAVQDGSYLGLGNALIRDERLSGFVINEAQGGATTFGRLRCGPTFCLPWGWEGMDLQLQRALKRVAKLDAFGNVLGYNADYLIIGLFNDCGHAGAMGVPHVETEPCTETELNEIVDRLRDLALEAVSHDITPIVTIPPKFEEINNQILKDNFNLKWVMDKTASDTLRELIQTRIPAEVSEAILVDAWADFEYIEGDGHPTYETAERAAKRYAHAMHKHQQSQ